MADLTDVLPNFDQKPWKHLFFSLEKKGILTAELVALDPIEIAKRCPLPLKEVRRLTAAISQALKADLGFASISAPPRRPSEEGGPPPKKVCTYERTLPPRPLFVRTLDPAIDECLGGGFAAGSITEIVGESAVGKTQFVLGLLLSAQLPPPSGLGRPTLYLSTEEKLNTTRLHQILRSHPQYQESPAGSRPSLDQVLTMNVHDMEAQDQVIQFQIPEIVRRRNIGLIVVDSIAANYRVEFSGSTPKVLARRAASLVRLGNVLRLMAHDQNVAIVVNNQVADRFEDARTQADRLRLSSQAPSSSVPSSTQSSQKQGQSRADEQLPPSTVRATPVQVLNPPPPGSQVRKKEVVSLDFQQRFFTGWGDNPNKAYEAQKTPALGLTWANQIDTRVVLKMGHTSTHMASDTGNVCSDVKRRRFLSVVFSPWAPITLSPVGYSLEMQGPVSLPELNGTHDVGPERYDQDFVENEANDTSQGSEHAALLDPKYWDDLDDNDFL